MDIRELRIGNSVLHKAEKVKIVTLDADHFDKYVSIGVKNEPGAEWIDSLNEIQPIPLTPELVEELGFEKSEDESDNKDFLQTSRPLKGWYQDPQCKKFIQECLKDPELAKEFSEQNFCSLFHYENEEKQEIWLLICAEGNVYVSYLHELENMYHYLTGRELIPHN